MKNIENLSTIGIGTYRMSIEDNNHIEALKYAIENEINLIDTASNYQNGNSQKLIGKIIDNSIRKDVFIITKAGYIQGNDIHKLSLINRSNTIQINEQFYYSIDKSFINIQIEQSLERMNTEYIDCFLLHNPEHYFDVTNDLQKDIDDHIIKAFQFLEKLVESGKIRYYGISSNHLPIPSLKNFRFENLLKLKRLFPHFKIVQFPYNIVEDNASKKLYGSKSLIDICKNYDIKCISNRPLNTVFEGKTLKLIHYHSVINNNPNEMELFECLLELIQNRLDEIGEKTPVEDFLPINFLIKNRKQIANEEALDKFISNYLIPFLNKIKLLDNNIINLVSLLRKEWCIFVKQYNEKRLIDLKKIKGISEDEDLMRYLNNYYSSNKIDNVLMGLRSKKYIKEILKSI